MVNFGYQGMASAIDALVDRKDVIVSIQNPTLVFSTEFACIRENDLFYAHNEIDKLEIMLQRATKIIGETDGGILVITEGVFGMGGDTGKLPEIVALKKKYDFRLFVDDAHGIGTMGETGAGTGEHYGVQDDIDIYFGTFAKAFASIGGFISSTENVVDYLRYNMRSQIFAKSLSNAFGCWKPSNVLELFRNDTSFKDDLWKIADALQAGLKAEGFNLG